MRTQKNVLRQLHDSIRPTARVGTQRCYVRSYTVASSASGPSSVNKNEIEFFSRLSSQWWNENGEFGMLHKMNSVRMQFIRDKILETAGDEGREAELEEKARSGKFLQSLDVLDVGCGGGLLSEVCTANACYRMP